MGLWNQCSSELSSIFESGTVPKCFDPLLCCAIARSMSFHPRNAAERSLPSAFRAQEPAAGASHSEMTVQLDPHKGSLSTPVSRRTNAPQSLAQAEEDSGLWRIRGLLEGGPETIQVPPRFWILILSLPSLASRSGATSPDLWTLLLTTGERLCLSLATRHGHRMKIAQHAPLQALCFHWWETNAHLVCFLFQHPGDLLTERLGRFSETQKSLSSET